MKNTDLINFTLVDYGVIFLILVSIVIGLFRGFVKEVLSIVVWTLSVFAALKFYEELSIYFTGITDNSTIRSGIAIAVIFIGCLIIGSIISHLISVLVKSTGLSGTDRLLGVIFGFLRGVLVVAVIILIVNYSEFSKDPMWKDSYIANKMQPLVNWLQEFVPSKVNVDKFSKDPIKKSKKE